MEKGGKGEKPENGKKSEKNIKKNNVVFIKKIHVVKQASGVWPAALDLQPARYRSPPPNHTATT